MERPSMQFSLSAEQRRLLDQLLDDSRVGQAVDRIGPRTGATDRAPLSFGQERLFLVDRLRPGSPMYVGTGALRLRGSLDPALLERCFALLVKRHEVLRTAIGESPETGELEQRILGADEIAVRVPVRETTRGELHRTVSELASEGFDLARPPLLRAVLLKVSDAPEPEWTLVLSVHHIVVDGWSMGLLMTELGTAYAALSEGRAAGLPPLALQYADFAAWQRGTLEQGLLDGQLQFWRETLDGVPMVDVPADRPRPAQRGYAGDTVPLRLPASVVKGLRALTDEAQATLFMGLVAGWSIVLGRWSGEDDVVVGTPVAGRRRAELESTVGFFVNTLPLRVGLEPGDDFRALLRRTRDVCVDAFAHQDVSFERIVAEVPAERDVSGQTTLARHWLVLHNTPPLAFSVPGLEAEVLPSLVGTVRCDLSVQLVPEKDGGLDGWLEYSTELFDRDTAGRLAAALVSVLAAAAKTPGRAVRELPVMSPQEYERVVGALASEPAVESRHTDVVAWFETQADRTPDAIAVIADRTGEGDTAGAGDSGAEVLTYAELDGRANRVAHLLAGMGVGPEDRVGVCLARGADLIAAALGVLKAGAVHLPLDPDYPAARLEQLVGDGAPRIVLTGPTLDELFPGRETVTVPEGGITGLPDHRPVKGPLASGRAAALLFTSGSTGRPKGVVLTHGGLLNRLAGMREAYAIDAGDRVLQKAPIGFDVSLWELLLPVVCGAAVVQARPGGHRDADYLHELIDWHGVTVCHFVPSMLREFLASADAAGAGTGAHPSVRVFFSGGEKLSAEQAGLLLDRHPAARLFNQYGPTEAVIDVTAGQVGQPVPAGVPIGRPVPGTELLVLDAHGRPQPIGVPGELFIGGVQLARGYFGAPGATAERFVPHPFARGERLYATGDRVRRLPDGSLEFLGRGDSQVKVRGHRVEAGEVEGALRRHPAVYDALVRVRVDDTGQAQLVGYVTTGAEEAPAGLDTELRELLGGLLPEAMVPSHLVVLDRWPLNAHGKVDTAALPEQDGRDSGIPYEAPRTPLEARLAEVCAELLGVERLGRHDSFFALGGHSLLALRAISRIRAEFGVRVQVGQFFKAPDLASLAELVAEKQTLAEGAPSDAAPIPRIDRRRV
ncbi:amino acid adenylation domain-containing protein [Actinacidiphila glaucinigra]|uniref:non-ribosomal peptide synthetase n=1 Tax=Actinacidiphila glaucinigra TaxID=235986 RepID=UPI002DD7AF05|nr:amino acid adenylation domain-containing protein [Actinacidiphila glaucinigra]WSD64847.1 amino acid adenylation domain-containing protein [Actinacidiphila glaucinigra]